MLRKGRTQACLGVCVWAHVHFGVRVLFSHKPVHGAPRSTRLREATNAARYRRALTTARPAPHTPPSRTARTRGSAQSWILARGLCGGQLNSGQWCHHCCPTCSRYLSARLHLYWRTVRAQTDAREREKARDSDRSFPSLQAWKRWTFPAGTGEVFLYGIQRDNLSACQTQTPPTFKDKIDLFTYIFSFVLYFILFLRAFKTFWNPLQKGTFRSERRPPVFAAE